ETSRLCSWHLPASHYLESWSDARAFDGTASIIQPLISPLYETRSAHEIVATLAGERDPVGLHIIQAYWRTQSGRQGADASKFDAFWQTALHDGVVAGSASPPSNVRLRGGWQSQLAQVSSQSTGGGQNESNLEIVFQVDPTIYDGRYANNGWLQELPKPI